MFWAQHNIVFLVLICFSLRVHSKESCDCKTLYIYAEAAIESKQSATLGRYTLQVDAKDETPVYKRVKENWQTDGDVKNHFLIFRNGDWLVSSSPDEEYPSFYITMRLDNFRCPDGIEGGYERNVTLDSTFKITCLDSVIPKSSSCCDKVEIQASKNILKLQSSRIGVYTKVDEVYNGFPVYRLNKFERDNFLYMELTGRQSNGWTINDNIGGPEFAITTRSRTDCPEDVKTGYDRDEDEDDTFKIICAQS